MTQHLGHEREWRATTAASPAPTWQPRGSFLVAMLLSNIGVLLAAGRTSHVIAAAPLLLLSAYPFMHLFLGDGLGGHNHADQKGERP
ncbi:MAG: DUF2933 domain-containing protein [Alphaproteobacteria bacterium]|nr:DUF2933 domain-containing protein [Alphaproteobacteria bacterium]